MLKGRCSKDGAAMDTMVTAAITWERDGADDDEGAPMWLKRRQWQRHCVGLGGRALDVDETSVDGAASDAAEFKDLGIGEVERGWVK